MRFNFATSCVSDKAGERIGRSGSWGAGLLGILFALSFCPVSAALFFGSMLPLAVNKNGTSVLLPSAYGAGTGVPVFVFAVLIALGAQVANACAELDFAADISQVTNLADILDFGVMRTPAVVIDGEVVISGRVPTVSELKDILERRWA